MVTRLAFFTEGGAESQDRREKINKNFLLRRSVVETLQKFYGSQSPIQVETLYQMAIKDVTGDPSFATSKKIAKFFMSLGIGTHPNRHNEDTEKFWQVLCDHLRHYYPDNFENMDEDCSGENIGRQSTAILGDAMSRILPAVLAAAEVQDPVLSNFFQFAAPMFLSASGMSFNEAVQHGQPILEETERYFVDEFNRRNGENASNFDEMFGIECRKDASQFALSWLGKRFTAKAFLHELPKMYFFDHFYRFIEDDISQGHLDSPFVKIFDLLIADYVSVNREQLWKHSAECNYGYAIQSLEEHATESMFKRLETGAVVIRYLEHILDGFVEHSQKLHDLREILPWVFLEVLRRYSHLQKHNRLKEM